VPLVWRVVMLKPKIVPTGMLPMDSTVRFTPTEPFRPALGLASPHAQTCFAGLFRSRRTPPVRRERWDTQDGDFIDVDILPAAPEAPHLFVLHGLEGSAEASYVAEVLRLSQRIGWGAFALNFRSCSGEPNRLPRFYHSGETGDALHAIERVRERVRGPLFGVGFSLGGNVLLLLLARTGEQAPLDAAAVISVPYDLQACARALDTSCGFGWVYRRYFLRSLKRKAMGKLQRHPGAMDAVRIRAARGIESFDEAVTAPLHGFASAAEYYRQSSSGPQIARIRRPTLLISSLDDPLVPLPPPPDAMANPFVTALFTEHGGHVGFISGTIWRPRYWAERQALHFLSRQLV